MTRNDASEAPSANCEGNECNVYLKEGEGEEMVGGPGEGEKCRLLRLITRVPVAVLINPV